ncbi:MAG: hypothetical protein IKY43_04700 [Bacteroidales bacterium]|nr:hypothetical protein [Bacteroidales bacterium]
MTKNPLQYALSPSARTSMNGNAFFLNATSYCNGIAKLRNPHCNIKQDFYFWSFVRLFAIGKAVSYNYLAGNCRGRCVS